MMRIIFLTLALAISAAAGGTLKVGDGKPYQSIQAAVDASESGDKIKIYPGNYDELVRIYDKDDLKIKAAGKGGQWVHRLLILRCTDVKVKGLACNKLQILGSDDCEAKDIEVIYTPVFDGTTHTIYGIEVGRSSDIDVDDCSVFGPFIQSILVSYSDDIEVDDCYCEGAQYFGIRHCYSTDVELDDNEFHNVPIDVSDICNDDE